MYKFIKKKDPENKFDNTTVVMTVDAIERQELINAFIEFLGASGFSTKDLEEEWYA